MRKVLYFSSIMVLFGFFLIVNFQFLQREKGFSPKKIASYYPPNSKEITDKLPDEALFNQSYSYLGSGKSCYAFQSADQKYVIKFFKQNKMRKKGLSSPKERKNLFQSINLANERLKKETALLYIHLSKSRELKQKLTIFDQNGKPFVLDLDHMEFIVQKRAKPVFFKLEKWMKKGEEAKAREAISSILTIIKRRCDEKLLDNDVNCRKNIGLIGREAVEIDIGEFSLAPENYHFSIENEMRSCIIDLSDWLEEKYPSLYQYLQTTLKSYS